MAAFSDVQTSLTNLGAAITAEIAAVTADIQALSAGASPAQLDTIVASLNTLRRLHRLLNTKRVAKPAKANDSPTFFS